MQRRLSRIYKYWVKYNNRQRLSIRIIDAASQIQNLDPGKSSKNIISIIIGGITFVMAMIAFGVERIEEAAKKSKIAHLTRYSKKSIAVDVDDLLENKSDIRCFCDDFTYNAVVQDSYLKNIEIIFGNAYLGAMQNLDCFKKLKYVSGDIYYKGNIYKRLSDIQV